MFLLQCGQLPLLQVQRCQLTGLIAQQLQACVAIVAGTAEALELLLQLAPVVVGSADLGQQCGQGVTMTCMPSASSASWPA